MLTIAGKPHAAPVVVERQYGDCKDKAVLFITLARLAGLRFTLLLCAPEMRVRSVARCRCSNSIMPSFMYPTARDRRGTILRPHR